MASSYSKVPLEEEADEALPQQDSNDDAKADAPAVMNDDNDNDLLDDLDDLLATERSEDDA